MKRKVYEAVISGESDHNIRYDDFCNLIENLGFTFIRQRGSHVIYVNYEINERLNVQKDGSKAKGYQVKQLRELIFAYSL